MIESVVAVSILFVWWRMAKATGIVPSIGWLAMAVSLLMVVRDLWRMRDL